MMVLKTLTIIAALVVLTAIQVSAEGNHDIDNVEQNIFIDKIVAQPESMIQSRTLRNTKENKRRQNGKPKTGGRNKVGKKNKGKKGPHTRKGKLAKKQNRIKGRRNKGRAQNRNGNKKVKNKRRRTKKGRKHGKTIKKNKNKNTGRNKGKHGKERRKKIKKTGRNQKGNGKDKMSNKKKKKTVNKKRKPKGKRIKVKQATPCEECVVKLAVYAKLYVAQAKNRNKQILRMEQACATSKKKMTKKALFKEPYDLMLENAGGNKTDPKCKGKSITVSRQANDSDPGVASKDDLEILEACNATIGGMCSECQLDNATMKAAAEVCKASMIDFIKKMDNCLDSTKFPTQAKLCECVDQIDADGKIEAQIRSCKWVTDASLKEVEYKKACVKEFSKCRKAEDAAVGHIHKCKLPMLTCGGVDTVEEAEKTLPILKDLKTELDATEAAVKAALEKLGMPALDMIEDAKNPSGLAAFIKDPAGSPASRAASDCRNLAVALLGFNESAVATGEQANDKLDLPAASTTTDLLKEIKIRELETELGDCNTGSRQQALLLGLNRAFLVWMVMWRQAVVEVKIVVLSLVISNAASDDDATTVAGGDTTAAATTAGGDTTAAGETTAGETTAAVSTTPAAVVTARAQARNKRFLELKRFMELKEKVLL